MSMETNGYITKYVSPIEIEYLLQTKFNVDIRRVGPNFEKYFGTELIEILNNAKIAYSEYCAWTFTYKETEYTVYYTYRNFKSKNLSEYALPFEHFERTNLCMKDYCDSAEIISELVSEYSGFVEDSDATTHEGYYFVTRYCDQVFKYKSELTYEFRER